MQPEPKRKERKKLSCIRAIIARLQAPIHHRVIRIKTRRKTKASHKQTKIKLNQNHKQNHRRRVAAKHHKTTRTLTYLKEPWQRQTSRLPWMQSSKRKNNKSLISWSRKDQELLPNNRKTWWVTLLASRFNRTLRKAAIKIRLRELSYKLRQKLRKKQSQSKLLHLHRPRSQNWFSNHRDRKRK